MPGSSRGPIYLFIYFSNTFQASRAAAWLLSWRHSFIYLFIPCPLACCASQGHYNFHQNYLFILSPAPCPQVAARLISPAYPFIYLFIPQPSSIIACPSGILMHTYSFIYLSGNCPALSRRGLFSLSSDSFIYLISQTHVPSIGPPVIIFVSAGSSAGLRNRVGDSPCLQTVRIPFRKRDTFYLFIYFPFSSPQP